MLNKRKDEKIQLYRKVTQVPEGSTKKVNYRQFIYSEDKFMSGGLYANARTMTNTEVESGGLQHDKFNVKFTVNRNPKLATDLKVIYRGQTYDIQTIDDFDFRSIDNAFTAIRNPDTTEYEDGDLFDDD